MIKNRNRLFPYFAFFIIIIALFSCHTKKGMLKGRPGDVVKPQAFIAEKYGQLMHVEKSDIQNGRLYSFIDDWMGTPYKFGGLDKNGIDCSGLVYLLEQEVYGTTVPRMTSAQITVIKRKYENELTEGDLVFFDFDGKKFSHVGVYLQNGYVVHASSTKGVVLVNLHDPSLYKHFSRAGSVIEGTPSSTDSSN
jgi:hypothetical protein